MRGKPLKGVNKLVEQTTAVDRAKAKAHQPIAGQFLILDAAERRESEGKNCFSLVLKSPNGAMKDRISNQSVCFGESAFGRAEIAHNLAPFVNWIEKCKSLQITLAVEGKELADIDLVIEDGRPGQKCHLAVLHPAGLPPSFRDGLQFFAIEGSH